MNLKSVVRYMVLLLGLFIMACGIALVVKSNLGTSPISSVPYIFSLIFPLTFGQLTFLLSIIFIFTEMIMLGSKFPKVQLLQIVVGISFGFFTDFGMYIFSAVNPEIYLNKIITLLTGCILMGLGVYLQVAADVIINPGEGVVRVIARKTSVCFGNIKIAFDITLAVFAIIISLTHFGAVYGIREGTIISACSVGFIVKIWSRIANHVKNALIR